MCGIAGIINLETQPPPRQGELEAMLAPLHHRGPDGTGTKLFDAVGLAHARLSIIDLAGGAQPIHNEDGTVWVVFNGEIFNYVELRADLEKAGHRFYTHSDTEVLVHLYEERGLAFADALNGQFAIALYDTRVQRLVLVRDRPGILPLFVMRQGKRLAFASEVKALLPLMPSGPRLDPLALDQLMTFWAPVSPRGRIARSSASPSAAAVRVMSRCRSRSGVVAPPGTPIASARRDGAASSAGSIAASPA